MGAGCSWLQSSDMLVHNIQNYTSNTAEGFFFFFEKERWTDLFLNSHENDVSSLSVPL